VLREGVEATNWETSRDDLAGAVCECHVQGDARSGWLDDDVVCRGRRDAGASAGVVRAGRPELDAEERNGPVLEMESAWVLGDHEAGHVVDVVGYSVNGRGGGGARGRRGRDAREGLRRERIEVVRAATDQDRNRGYD